MLTRSNQEQKTTDWRIHLLALRNRLRLLNDAGLRIFHGVVLSPHRSATDLQPVIEMLEPAFVGKNLAKSVEIETDDCAFHGHFFFADDRRGLNQLERLLHGVGTWLKQVPDELLPPIQVPVLKSQTDRNLVHWVSAVYNIAWKIDEVYLQAELEYLQSIQALPFLPWIECPQPSGCDPQSAVTHHESGNKPVPQWVQAFTHEGLQFPDVISAYLREDLVASSIAAIDLLVYRMPQELTDEAAAAKNHKLSKSGIPRHQGEKASADRTMLLAYLLEYHDSSEGRVRGPLKQIELADRLGWSQPRVSRRMKRLFPEGMKGYIAAFANGIPKGFGKGGLYNSDIEAVAEETDET